ncbi:hypothetical protein CFAM422_012057 [Trichoderma lentiforme]|uniref:Uncharacterized protein n=1 Tax=Trichoderma lentiforme TaxID=1567552 RepID=A0A9P4X4Q7_9HYPO|nr:hypothetical protein CFAM422_012057 [Trichoderma lentiforme]
MGGPTARKTVFQQWRWCLNRHLTVRRRSSAGTLDSAALAECPVSPVVVFVVFVLRHCRVQ